MGLMLDQALIVFPGINKDTNNAFSSLFLLVRASLLSSLVPPNKALYADFLRLETRAVEEGLLVVCPAGLLQLK